MPTLPPAVAALRERLDVALVKEIDRTVERLVGLHPGLRVLSDGLRDFVLQGGKRLRPLFVLLGYQAAGGDDLGRVMGPALAVELVHTCALVHDDLIDRSVLRRGRPAVHLAFAASHAAEAAVGDRDRFGEAAALLLGDLAFVEADELFVHADVPPSRLVAAFRVFTSMREEVTIGQYLDVEAAWTRTTSVELALAVARYKSGSYSVARPLQIGALLAEEGEVLARDMARVGVPLGQAFQLRDDVLSVFGTQAETGKPTLSDLAEGKRTLLVAETTERLDPTERVRLDALLGRPDLTEDQADEIRLLMRSSGGLAATERRCDELMRAAMAALDALKLDEDARTAIGQLAAYLVARRT